MRPKWRKSRYESFLILSSVGTFPYFVLNIMSRTVKVLSILFILHFWLSASLETNLTFISWKNITFLTILKIECSSENLILILFYVNSKFVREIVFYFDVFWFSASVKKTQVIIW